MDRPLIAVIEETKKELYDVINRAIVEKNTPCYFLEGLLRQALAEVEAIAKKEIEAAAVADKRQSENAENPINNGK